MTRLVSAGAIAAAALFLTGCGSGPGGVSINFSGSKQASEERNLTAPLVAGSGVEVTTDLGSVEIAADPSLKEVTITAASIGRGD
jgi:spermidine/putrescine-binding protein